MYYANIQPIYHKNFLHALILLCLLKLLRRNGKGAHYCETNRECHHKDQDEQHLNIHMIHQYYCLFLPTSVEPLSIIKAFQYAIQ